MDQRPSSSFTYDVFLSFRGSDTRYGFTGNLYKALCDKGIHTFIDDTELQGGDEIKPSLMGAIEKSRIAIPVFSINYASSRFCLDELVNIMKRKDIMLVVPIFYSVDPSDVRHQNGSYGKALANHEKEFKANKEKLKEWKRALHQAADLSGHHFTDGKEYENEFIGKIVNLVSSKISRAPLHVKDDPVGLESQIQEVKRLLDVQSDKGANMVGIHGPGGIGKTTLAKAIYNLMAYHFDCFCFLGDVRANSEKDGLPHLQSTLLSKIIGEKKVLTCVEEGMSMIKHRLQQKKVLLILDDVDSLAQLEAIVGGPDWMGPGSKVVITTRDKQLLACHKVENIYEMKELNKEDALQLLRRKAFRSEQVDSGGYVDVLNRAVTYASGLPLALEVIGSNLCGKSIKEWESALNQYARIPHNQIIDILKISYDTLQEEEKSVFLDIACCFNGYHLTEVKEILSARHGDNMEYHISVLVDRSLIKIVGLYEVKLHDLIEEMGKAIDRRESPKELEERSRLWFHKDVVQILKHTKESNKIEIIFLQFPFSEVGKKVEWDKDAFKKMKSLKTLIVKNGYFSQGPRYLPNSLRVLEWNKYPSKDLPSGFRPDELVICKLPMSRISSLKSICRKEFVSLTNLSFDKCEYLKQIPDVSCLKSLEILSFKCCWSLLTIHNSVGSLKKLKVLDAFRCIKLRSIPPLEMTSLETLHLSRCTRLESFPEILVEMENMRDIRLGGTPMMKELPRSFQNLTRLRSVDLLGPVHSDWDVVSSLIECTLTMPELTIILANEVGGWVMPKEDEGEKKVSSLDVKIIDLTNCKLTDEFFLAAAELLCNVTLLGHSSKTFAECFEELCSLQILEFKKCTLQEIRGIPPNLQIFEAIDCPLLTASCGSMILKQERHESGNTIFFIVPPTGIPEWMDHRSEGTSISFWFRNKSPHFLLCVVLPKFQPIPKHGECHVYLLINGIKCSDAMEAWLQYTLLLDPVYLKFSPRVHLLENEWNHAEVIFVDQDNNPILVQGGIHVLKQESSMEDIWFTNPCTKRKLEDDPDNSEAQNHPLLKNCRLADMEVVETQIVPQQPPSLSFRSFVLNQARRLISPFLPAFATQSLNDQVSEDSKNGSLDSTQIRGCTGECQRENLLVV